VKIALAALLLTACADDAFNLAPYVCPVDGVCANDPDNPGNNGNNGGIACIDGKCQHFTACSPVKQGVATTCGTGTSKCTLVLQGNDAIVGACVPQHGIALAEGASCTMSVPPVSSAAAQYPTAVPDACSPGFICATPLFDPALTPACHSFCNADTDCTVSGDHCFQVQGPSFGALIGICFPGCDVFNPSSCPSGQACAMVSGPLSLSQGFCVTAGTLKLDDLCSLTPRGVTSPDSPTPQLCQAGLQCTQGTSGASRCTAICSASNTQCPAGKVCQTSSGCSGGVCFCN